MSMVWYTTEEMGMAHLLRYRSVSTSLARCGVYLDLRLRVTVSGKPKCGICRERENDG